MAVGKTGTMILIATALGLVLVAGCASSAQTGAAAEGLVGSYLTDSESCPQTWV